MYLPNSISNEVEYARSTPPEAVVKQTSKAVEEQCTEVVAWYSFLPKDTGMHQPLVLTLRQSIQDQNLCCFELTTDTDCLKYHGSREEMRERFLDALRQYKEIVDASMHRKPDLIFKAEHERSIEVALQLTPDDEGLFLGEKTIHVGTGPYEPPIAPMEQPQLLKKVRT